MHAKDAIKIIGQVAVLHVAGLDVDVQIQDVKTSYGKTRYQVRPLAGRLESWFEAGSISFPIGGDR